MNAWFTTLRKQSLSKRMRWQSFLIAIFYVISLLAPGFATQTVQAAPVVAPQAYTAPAQTSYVSGKLTIEPITAYNLIVDSNVLAPSSYGPSAATLGAKFCNTDTAQMDNVWAFIGNFNPATNIGKPGEYPVRPPASITENSKLATATETDFGADDHGAFPTKLFSLKHQSGSVTPAADASRYIGTLKAGECRTQYWLVSYPRKALTASDGWVKVTGDIKPEDDLWLSYYFWATSNKTGTTPSYIWRPVTMRNEISAMANKIWPNGDNKVPTEYRNLVTETVGWNTKSPNPDGVAYPGQVVTSEGIWYDFGNIGAGFDNNYDLTPDRNAWVQPIGDAGQYDPGCFRLVRTHGVVIVKLTDGSNLVIPFEDRMYFENIPDNNNGAIGLVYYDYVALDGACTAGLTPYQEVASGYDNEKFNADFGSGTPPLQSTQSTMTLDKNGTPSVGAGGEVTYNLTFTLPEAKSGVTNYVTVGNPSLGMPLVYGDTIPSGMTYKGGSATTSVTGAHLPSPLSATVLFSTDSGYSWSATDPGDVVSTGPDKLVKIQWWLSQPITQQPYNSGSNSVTGTVSFKALAPAVTPPPILTNTGCLQLGNGPCFTEDSFTTLVTGSNTIRGTVFEDTNVKGDALWESASEPRDANITVTLYYDANNNGKFDAEDFQVGAEQSTDNALSTTYNYSFGQLPNGTYWVKVDSADADIPTGFTNTTPTVRKVVISGADVSGVDFGFAPALSVTKLLNSPNPTVVGAPVQYTVRLANTIPGSGGPNNYCTYRIYPSKINMTAGAGEIPPGDNQSNQQWKQTQYIAGAPDSVNAYSDLSGANNYVGLTGFNIGNLGGTITRVEFIAYLSERQPLQTGDAFQVQVYHNGAALGSLYSYTAGSTFTHGVGVPFATTPQNITGLLGSWSFADFSNNMTAARLIANKGGSNSGNINVDSFAFQITTDQVCDDPSQIINPLRLTDTFPAANLNFVSANPPVSSSSAGTLTWDNLGPLYPGQIKEITVNFTAAATSTPVTAINLASVTSATFGNGRAANLPTSSINEQIVAPRSLSGVVWYDKSPIAGNGWVDPTGYEATDGRIPNVEIQLWACKLYTGEYVASAGNNDTCATKGGIWQQIATKMTAADGSYQFTGLYPGYYRAVVNTNTLPLTSAAVNGQTGDPNDTGRKCTTSGGNASCDNQLGAAGDNLNGGAIANLITSTSKDTVNFGYNYTAGVFGTVWEDVNDSHARDAGEDPLARVKVNLYQNSTCTGLISATDTTDSFGNFFFGDLANGINYCVAVDSTTLPNATNNNWTETSEVKAGTDDSINNSILLTGTTGTNQGSMDFGWHRSGTYTIGDTLFYDWDGDGVQDAIDEGIPNVTIELYEDSNGNGVVDSNDLLVGTTSTDMKGVYTFPNLAVNTYIVNVLTTDTDFPSSSNETKDPDENGKCTVCDSKALVTAGQMVAETDKVLDTIDFAYRLTGGGQIGDTVFRDMNKDGVQSGTQETGIAGVKVTLQVDLNGDNNFVMLSTMDTDSSGKYLFTNLPTALNTTKNSITYRVTVDSADAQLPKDGFGVPYRPSLPVSYDTTLNAMTSSILTDDFGFAPLAALGDTVYLDINGNGTQDYNEPGIPNVIVRLYTFADTGTITSKYDSGDTLGAQVGPDQPTDANGYYQFTALTPGYYVAIVDTSTVIVPGKQLTGDPDADGVPCTASPAPSGCDDRNGMRLYAGTNYTGADFGYQPTGVVGDRLWLDSDGDGAQDAGEPGIPFVDINLTGPGCSPCTVETDINGNYLFGGLGNGDYTVSVNTNDPDFPNPIDMVSTYDADSTHDGSTALTIAGGTVTALGTCSDNCSLNADFGYQYSGTSQLSGTVCLDSIKADADGVNQTYAANNADQIGVCGADAAAASGTGTGEAPFKNILVNLYQWVDTNNDSLVTPDELTSIGVTSTLANGDYSFTSLPSNALYVVSLSKPLADVKLTTITGDSPQVGDDTKNEPKEAVVDLTVSGTTAYQIVQVGSSDTVQNVDFAFTTTATYDFGDLPDTYSTSIQGVPDGPRHVVEASPTLFLGTKPDAEENATPTADASGDGADEDGVIVSPTDKVWSDGTGAVQVKVNGTGYLAGWIDFNKDGDFKEANEFVIGQPVTGTGAGRDFTFTVPGGTFPTQNVTLFARFRLFPSAPDYPQYAYTGPASAGEVEDDMFIWGSQADLSVTKTDGAATYIPGRTVTYTIVAANAGPDPVTGATVTDTFPAGLTNAIWNCNTVAPTGGATCAAAGSQIGNINTTVDLPANSTVTFTVTATVQSSRTGNLANTATIIPPAGVPDPNPGNESATDTDTPTPQADLGISKDDGSTTYTPGGTVSYTIVVTNAGPGDVTGATVTDTLPAGLSSPTWDCSTVAPTGGATCAASGSQSGNITTTVNLPANSTVTFQVNATVLSSRTGNLVNTATVTPPAGTGDPNPGNESATDSDTPNFQADLEISKGDGVTTYSPGGNLTYTIVVKNNGPSDVTGATVADTMPANLTNVSWNCDSVAPLNGATCAASGSQTGNINTTVNLPATGEVTFKVSAKVLSSATGNLVNTATVTPPVGTTDPNPGKETSTDSDTYSPQADLQITKTDGMTTYTPGGSLTYTIVVTNAGPSDVSGATVTDTLPTSLTGVAWNCNTITPTGGASCAASGSQTGNINTTVNLPAGGTVTFQVTATVQNGLTGNLDNTATITPPTGTSDPNPGNESDTDTDFDQSLPLADLQISKTDNSATYTPGGAVTYTIVVTNAGPDAVTGATVTDSMPSGLTGVTWDCITVAPTGGATCAAPGTGTGNINTTVNLPVNGTVTFKVTATAASSRKGDLVNTATVTPPAGTSDPKPGNESATDTDTPNPQADLSIHKDDGTSTYVPGKTLTYTIVATNNGLSDVNGAIVVDALPAQITRWQWTCSAGSNSSCSGTTGWSTANFSDVVDLNAGETITYRVDAQVDPDCGDNLNNTAVIQTPNGITDTVPGNNTSTDSDMPAPEADLALTKDDGLTIYTAGGMLTYQIVVTNLGPSKVWGATVSDVLPAGLTNVNWDCDTTTPPTGNGLCWATGLQTGDIDTQVDLSMNDTVTFTVHATVAPGMTGALSNTATVTVPADTTDANMDNNSATDTDHDIVTPQADLQITKSDGSATYVPGGKLIYTIQVTNASAIDVAGAVITDNRPAQITQWTWACATPGNMTCDGAPAGSANFTDTVDMKAGEVITYTVTAQIDSGASGDLVNTASVMPPRTIIDPTPSNNTATDTDTAAPDTDLALTKTVDLAKFSPGGTLVYTLTVTNNGPSDAQQSVLTDPLPAQVQFISATPAPVDPAAATLTWNLGTIKAKETRTILLTVKVRDGVKDGFTNTATVTTTTGETTTTNNTGSAVSTPETPTPVELLYFRVKAGGPNKVVIQWAAASEVDMFGYRLMRANKDNLAEAVEVAYIPIDPLTRTYEVTDGINAHGRYWYWLVEVNTYGAENVTATNTINMTGFFTQVYLPTVRR